MRFMCYNFSMDYAKVKSYAKINLGLSITGRDNGYHSLESVVVTVDLCDVISIVKRKKDKLVGVTMSGLGSEQIPFESNNAVKAARAFIERYDTCGVDISIRKNIPMGAGLGGSSADISGVLRAMSRLFGTPDWELKALADGLGSDCGYMLYGGYAQIGGRGEKVSFIDSSFPLDIGILLPKTPVSTAECYKKYDEMNVRERGDFMQNIRAAIFSSDKRALGQALCNSLYAPACALNPDVEKACRELAAFDPFGVGMTGSGSAVFAIFENDSFLRYAKSRYSGSCEFIMTKTKLPAREDKNGGRKTY